jgi:restriction system protein
MWRWVWVCVARAATLWRLHQTGLLRGDRFAPAWAQATKVPTVGVPDYETLMRPTLAALSNAQPQTRGQIRDAVASATGIDGDDLAQILPSGKATVFGSRVGWALTYMAQAGLATRPKRGVYLITDRGLKVLDEHSERVDSKVLAQFPEFLEFRARRNEKGEPVGTRGEPSTSVSTLSPTEAIERLVSDADDAVAAELLDRILAQPPAFLERLGLQLLRAMGYGGREALLTHTGRPGDRGLDGVIRQDALGLDLVGVQAKRYDRDAAVQRPEMQAFVGALQGAQTNRGVFVTTGRFSTGARQFAEQVAMRLVLIDGTELTRLMVRYNVGVAAREIYELKAVDDDFFEDED